jgi:hypothetical protein
MRHSNRRVNEIASYPRNSDKAGAPIIFYPNVAPGTRFFAAETGASKRPNAPTGTERLEAESKKARQRRGKFASLHKMPDSQTEWWARQGSNL